MKWMLSLGLLVSVAATAAQPNFATEPFDVEATTLAPGFKGHDCVSLVRATKGKFKARDEFETQAAFAQRAEEFKRAQLTPTLRVGDLVAFPLSEYSAAMEYDPERSEAAFGLRDSAVTASTAAPDYAVMPAFDVVTVSSRERRYVAQNGYGARVNVTSSTHVKCGIAFPDRRSIFSAVTAKLPPDEARAMKANLGALVIGRIVPPGVVRLGGYFKPTRESPTELAIEGDALTLTLESVWYYNRKTGTVAAKK